MVLRSTHTYAVLEVSPEAFREIRAKLEAADYHHAIHENADDGPTIDMHGIGLAVERQVPSASAGAGGRGPEGCAPEVNR